MKQLAISPDLSLPLNAATQTCAFIARKGAGKTYGAGKLAECLLDAGVQVVVLDAVGNWWGLRLSADGKSAAYDIPVIGGLRGDIPLEAAGGKLIADIVVDTGRSLIIDVSQFSKADRQKFATAFAERLWAAKKAERHPIPVHLIIEESQLIVPEKVSGDTAKMVGIYEEIIRLGRNYGIGVTMISQRPQSVNKEVLNQTECLFVLQVNGAHERKALKDWITYHGAERSLVDELPGLPIGTAYIWSPQWLGILKKIRIGQKKTFDASATPTVGTTQIRRDLKPLDLDDLKTRMAATIERAKAENPAELRREIALLHKQLQVKPQEAKPTVWRVEIPILANGHMAELRGVVEALSKIADGILKELARVSSNRPVTPVKSSETPAPIVQRARLHTEPTGSLPLGEEKILIACAQYPDGATREQLTILTGYKRSTRDAYVQRLREKGYVECGALVTATSEGIAALGSNYEPLPTGSDLRDYWLARLPEGEKSVLSVLLDGWPNAVDREHVTDQTGYKRSTRDAYLQRLKTRQLVQVVGRGDVKASDILYD